MTEQTEKKPSLKVWIVLAGLFGVIVACIVAVVVIVFVWSAVFGTGAAKRTAKQYIQATNRGDYEKAISLISPSMRGDYEERSRRHTALTIHRGIIAEDSEWHPGCVDVWIRVSGKGYFGMPTEWDRLRFTLEKLDGGWYIRDIDSFGR